jgi:hypothetical protein
MIEARRGPIRKSTFRLPAYAISWAAILLAASNIALSQEKQSNPARPPSTNVQFVAGHQVVNIPFEFVDNQIILKVRVNDSAPLKFMFDTGASGSLLSAGKAAELHLSKVDSARATGVGGSKEGYLAAVSLSVPDVKVLNQRIFVLPLEGLPCEMRDIVGIMGYDFIKEFVVEINYEARTISLFDPLSYRYTGHGDVIPVTLKGTPRVRARLGLPGATILEGLFEIDTGSDGALSINSPFVTKHALAQSLKDQFAGSNSGLGGESKAIDARIGSFSLGRYMVASPIVSLSQSTEGALSVEDNDGPIGNEILHRFRVVLDYSRRSMMLEPNSHLSDPFENDMSGIALDSEGKDCHVFKVVGVEEKSPAAEAGIVVGDEIIAVDGKPANQFISTQIEKLLMQDGAERSLTLRRDGKARVVKIKLRRRI